jgi:hypothetical protein
MRNSDPIFWPSSEVDLGIRQGMNKNYTDCINILQTQWYQADLDQRFVMGDQDIWGLLFPGVATYRRKIFNFNILNSMIQSISGHQRQTRKSTICIPVHPDGQKTADQLTKCLFHLHKNGLYQTYSDAFEQGALTQGIGLVGFYPDYTQDPISPDIKARYIDFKSVLIDPYFRQRDLSDCRFIWTRQFFDKQEAATLYPKFSDDILAFPPGSYRDDKFYYMPEVYQIQFPNLIAFDEYWSLSSRKALFLVDKETEECQEFKGDEEDLRVIFSTFRNRFATMERSKPTIKRTIVINDKVLMDEVSPWGMDRYPFACSLAYFTPDSPYYAYKFRGVIRDARDCQYLLNRRKVSDLDILESQQQGLIIEQGALVTPDDSMNVGNGRVLVRKKGTSPDVVTPMQIIPPSPVMLQMEDMLMQMTHRIIGVDPAAMGIDVDDKAGIISMMRQAASARNLQRLFDQFDEFQQICGDIQIDMIQNLWTYGKVKQVIGEEPTAEFDNKLFMKYTAKVVAGALTETQQQLELAQLLHLQQIAPDLMPMDEIIECMTIQNKDRILEKIAAKQKAQEEQQKKLEEIQMQQIQVETATKMGYAHSQEALGKERLAKIELDKALNAERLQRAQEDKSAGILNLIKAVKELQGMDFDRFERGMRLVKDLEEQEGEQAKQEGQQTVTQEASV